MKKMAPERASAAVTPWFLGSVFFGFWLVTILLTNPAGDIMSDAILSTTVSVVDRHTIAVPGNSAIDLGIVRGRYVCGLEPGAWIAAMPYYALLRGVIARLPPRPEPSNMPRDRAAQVPLNPSNQVYYLQIMLVWFLMGPLYGGFATLLCSYLIAQGASAGKALAITSASSLGCLLLPYSAVYSRQAFGTLLIWSVLLLRWIRLDDRQAPTEAFGYGVLMGCAVCINYQMIFLVIFAGALLLKDYRPLERRAFIGGLALVLVILAWIQNWMYGSPLRTGYDFRYWLSHPFLTTYKGQAYWSNDLRYSARAFQLPTLEHLRRQAFGQFRGVLTLCPAIAAGIAGYVIGWRQKRFRPLAALAAATFLTYYLFNASLNDFYWIAGGPFFYGPRYILPGMPLLIAGAVNFDFKSRWTWPALAAILLSACNNILAAMYFDVFLTSGLDDPRLDIPVVYSLTQVLRRGPRIPLLDVYGAPHALQGLVFAAAAVSAAVLARYALRRSDRRFNPRESSR
jgi:hypothetical protein